MKTIWKYQLETTDYQKVEMPKGAEILTVQEQYSKPTLWVLVDDEIEEVEQRVINIYGTGDNMKPTSRKYIGTYQLMEGRLVFHVFEQL